MLDETIQLMIDHHIAIPEFFSVITIFVWFCRIEKNA